MWEYLIVTIGENGQYVKGGHVEDCDGRHPGECQGSHFYRDWKEINELGAEGWELVTAVFVQDSEAKGFFKRKLT